MQSQPLMLWMLILARVRSENNNQLLLSTVVFNLKQICSYCRPQPWRHISGQHCFSQGCSLWRMYYNSPSVLPILCPVQATILNAWLFLFIWLCQNVLCAAWLIYLLWAMVEWQVCCHREASHRGLSVLHEMAIMARAPGTLKSFLPSFSTVLSYPSQYVVVVLLWLT